VYRRDEKAPLLNMAKSSWTWFRIPGNWRRSRIKPGMTYFLCQRSRLVACH